MTFDVKKYPGYTEMLFRNRKPTLTRKKSLETFYTGDNKQVYLYDFYNKYYFFMKFEGFDPYINVHTDNKYQVSQFDKMIEEYQEKFKSIKIDDVEEQFVNVVTQKQPDDINPEYLDFCQKYIKRKGLDVPEEPVVVTECHKIGYDENGRMTFEKVEMEDETQIQEEPQENAPLSFSENALEEVQENEDDEWKGFPPETIVPIPTDEIDEEICNVKSEKVKKSKKKSNKKKSKK